MLFYFVSEALTNVRNNCGSLKKGNETLVVRHSLSRQWMGRWWIVNSERRKE